MSSPTGLVFYLADPKTNAPHYIGATDLPATEERDRLVSEARARGREPVHKWIRSLRTTPLLMTLPHADASLDEQLAVWHTIYGALDLLSQSPNVEAPPKLVTRFEEWVNMEHRRYAPLKPVSERRARRKPRTPPKPEPEPTTTNEEPKERPKPERQTARPRTTIFRCDAADCDFLAKRAEMRRHQSAYSHSGVTPVYDDETATVREYERQHATRKAKASATIPSHEIRECDECDFIGKKGRLTTHRKVTGHGGEKRLPQTPELEARYAKLTVPESGLARCQECGKLGKKQVIQNHHRITGHKGLTIIYADEKDVLAEYKANTKGGSNDTRYRCGGCEMATVSGALARHQRKTGHTGRTRVEA